MPDISVNRVKTERFLEPSKSFPYNQFALFQKKVQLRRTNLIGFDLKSTLTPLHPTISTAINRI